MAFKGVFPAPAIEPTEFGLFAVAKPNDHLTAAMDEEWVRGFYQMYNTLPNYVRGWDETSSTSYVSSSNPSSPLYRELKPIFLEVEDYRSTFDLPAEDKFTRAKLQLEGVSQKALEYELWNGEVTLAEGLPNMFLTDDNVTVIHSEAAHGDAYSPKRALSLLEHYVGEQSPAGEHGVLHLTRDAFIIMMTNNGVFMDNKDRQHMQTAAGTHVIIGSGYSGDGPHIAINTIAVSGGNLGTIVTSDAHYMKAGETFALATTAGGTAFDNTFTVKAVTNTTTFTFDITTSNQSATATPGNVQMRGSDTTKWIYATGRVDVLLGDTVVTNENLAQGYDVAGNKNDIRIKAMRPAIAYFDPSIHLAIKVDLTA
jgi:hypothetical protein